MNRILPVIFALLVVVLWCSQPTRAQEQVNNAKTDTTEAALREKAFATLESLANQIGSLQSAENRARIGANIAESLWTHDEKRARALFQLVKDDIKLGIQSPRGYGYRANVEVFLKLREDTVRRIAKYDAELALDFLRETFAVVKNELSFSDGQLSPELTAKEKALEVELARAFAGNNPESALKLAQKSLDQGFDEGLLILLRRLSAKHPADARLLHKKIVSKLAETEIRNDWQALDFSAKLVHYFPPPAADEGTFRELLEILLKTSIAARCAASKGSTLCYTIGYLVPQMEKYFPARTAELKRWVQSQPQPPISTYGDMQFQLEALMDDGTLEDIAALVSRYPEHESTIYFLAMRKAEWIGDLDRAKKIAGEYKGSDPEVRRRLTERVQRYAVSTARTQALMDEIRGNFEFTSPRQRIDQLLRLANHVALEDPKNAIKALGQVNEMVAELKPSDQMLVQIAMAMVYCLAKSDQGFAIMEALVPRLNELIAAGAKLDGFETNYLRDGEWNMSAAGQIGNLLTFLSRYAGHFAWYDFDRAMNLAAQFERGEIRMMAQLKLAQGILAGSPKRLEGGAVF